jgi:hypothetical protein
MFDCRYIDRNLDMAFRSRSKEASLLWRDLCGKLPFTAERLGAWALLDAVFRYPGSVACVRSCLAACPPGEVLDLFSQGLTENNLEAMTDLLRRGLDMDWSMLLEREGPPH